MNQVLMISPSGNYYGSEQVLHDYLKLTRLKSTVFVPEGSRFMDILQKDQLNANISIKGYSTDRLQNFYLSVIRKLFTKKYNAVYLNEAGHIRYIILLARFFKRVRFVVHVRLIEDTEYLRWGGSPKKNVIPVCISNFIIDNFKLPAHFIYDPYRFSKSSGSEKLVSFQGPFRIGVIGRITYSKGIEKVFDLARQIMDLGLQNKYVINFFGDVSSELEFSGIIESLRTMPNVKFLGFVDDKAKMYNQIDCVLHCNDAEPLGRIYLESVDFEIPFTGVKGGGIEEIAKKLLLDDLLIAYHKDSFPGEILAMLEEIKNEYIKFKQRVISAKPYAQEVFDPHKYASFMDELISCHKETEEKN